MNACKRIARVLAGVALVTTLGVIAVGWGWVPGSNEALASAIETKVAYERMLTTSQYLDEVLQAEHRATEAKHGIAGDVIAGRLTLLEAGALFSAADTDLNSESLRYRLDQFPGNSDAERHCRRVISYVEMALAAEPSELNTIVNRLNAELQDALERNSGIVSLPESDTVERRSI